MKKVNVTKEESLKKYFEQKGSREEIANEYGINYKTFCRWIAEKKNNLKNDSDSNSKTVSKAVDSEKDQPLSLPSFQVSDDVTELVELFKLKLKKMLIANEPIAVSAISPLATALKMLRDDVTTGSILNELKQLQSDIEEENEDFEIED
jgi:transposase-like protein